MQNENPSQEKPVPKPAENEAAEASAPAAPAPSEPAAPAKGGVKVEESPDVSGLNAPGVDLNTAPKAAEKAAPKAEEKSDAKADEKSDTQGIATEGQPATVPVKKDLDPNIVFGLGFGVLALFVWYIATEINSRKRVVGTLLTLAVTAMSAWFYFDQGMEKGIEIQGGVSMDIRIQPGEDQEVTPRVQEEAIRVLMDRFNTTSTKEIVLQKQGDDMLFLQIPGLGPDKVKEIEEQIQKVAILEFAVLDPTLQFQAQAMRDGDFLEPGQVALPYIKETDEKGEPLLGEDGNPIPRRWAVVPDPTALSGDIVKSARPRFGPEGWEIGVEFMNEGPTELLAITTANTRKPLAIILDREIVSSPNINEPFGDGCRITGNFSEREAKELAAALENPLKNPLVVEYSNYISPKLGAETVKQGMLAGVAGLVLTLLFILFYYRLAGIVAMIGMVVAISIIFGMMALFQFTLTLPGIAGIILTIGIAIDANVLIYERLREEMAGGKSIGSAIRTAYEKAFSAIVDANITTLITAIILFMVAVGTVKGFAITLMIGILATLFSALLVTRVCFSWGTETNAIKKLSFANFVPDKIIDFLGNRRKAVFASAVLIIASIIAVPALDPRGVELAGGDSLTLQSEEGLNEGSIEAALKTADFLEKEAILQVQQPVGGDSEFYLIRSEQGSADQIQDHIKQSIAGVKLDGSQTNSVGSTIGQSMLLKSLMALGFGLLAILLYVTIRFEFAFALGAIAALMHDLVITLGVTTLMGQELTLISIGALLTIAGYSINDTIVVFDRVREGLATKRGDVKDVINHSLNATLGRTLLTSVTTLFIVVVLYAFGGPALRNFALVLIIGVLIGTYSSIFVASPIVLWWARRTGTNLRREVLDTEQAKIDPMTPA